MKRICFCLLVLPICMAGECGTTATISGTLPGPVLPVVVPVMIVPPIVIDIPEEPEFEIRDCYWITRNPADQPAPVQMCTQVVALNEAGKAFETVPYDCEVVYTLAALPPGPFPTNQSGYSVEIRRIINDMYAGQFGQIIGDTDECIE